MFKHMEVSTKIQHHLLKTHFQCAIIFLKLISIRNQLIYTFFNEKFM